MNLTQLRRRVFAAFVTGMGLLLTPLLAGHSWIEERSLPGLTVVMVIAGLTCWVFWMYLGSAKKTLSAAEEALNNEIASRAEKQSALESHRQQLQSEIVRRERAEAELQGQVAELTKARTAALNMMDELASENAVRKRTAEELRHRTEELHERVKELNCLYDLSRLVEQPGATLDSIVKKIPQVLARGWQHLDSVCASITLDDTTATTPNYRKPAWRQTEPITVAGKTVGEVEVGYVEEKPPADEGPFLEEERLLLRAVAERIGHVVARFRATEQLRESEDRHRTLFEASRDAIMILAPPSWKFTSANPATVKMFQTKDEAEFISLGPWDVSPEFQPDGRPSAERAREMIEKAMQEGSHFFEWQHRRFHGPEFPTTVLLTRMELEGQPLLQATVRDISQAKRIENELRLKEEQLQHAQKMEAVGQLAGGIAHEFNNLLQAVRGYTRFAMDELPPASQPYQDLRQSQAASERAATLTRQLLDFSRQDPPEQTNTSLNEVVRKLARMLRPVLGERIQLNLNLDDGIGMVVADPASIHQALMNLCVNARDAMSSGGVLTIRSDSVWIDGTHGETHPDLGPGPHARITVSDMGTGMPPEVRERIFEPFFTTKEVGAGTGLGLAMVYGVVRQHSGSIHVYSEPGCGTSFKIYLPVSGMPAGVAESPHAQELPGGSETILIAEDELVLRNTAVRILHKAGYKTLTAADGEEAVQSFRDHLDDVSLVILDVVMPRMTGHEAFEEMEQLKPDVKAVFCTGYDPAATQTDFISQRGLPLVEKPFAASELLRVVRDVLDGRPAGEPREAVFSRGKV